MAGLRLSKNIIKVSTGAVAAAMISAAVPGAMLTVSAAQNNGWREENGVKYWYEDGVRQGVKYNDDGSIDETYRGKEIYDPESDAWYWLDNVQHGAVAKNKDVYQESEAGDWGDVAGADKKTYGKWVRYDENGHMVKGWQTTETGTYYFDTVYGTMAKGYAVIAGKSYYFDKDTGVLLKSDVDTSKDDDGKDFSENGWHKVEGVEYWYEDGVRQGVKYNDDGSIDETYRGKEIYDPSSDAWYWLDNVQQGAVAKNKDVYQESEAGDWGDAAGADKKTYGKWVRYDENGHMVKGWQTTETGTYYFDTVYGTMAKGLAEIDGGVYYFNSADGTAVKNQTVDTEEGKYTFGDSARAVSVEKERIVSSRWVYERTGAEVNDAKEVYYYDENATLLNYNLPIKTERVNAEGAVTSTTEYSYSFDERGNKTEEITKDVSGERRYLYEYDAQNRITERIYKSSTYESITKYKYEGDRLVEETATDANGKVTSVVTYSYDDNGRLVAKESSNEKEVSYYYTYYDNGVIESYSAVWKSDDYWRMEKTVYDEQGREIRMDDYLSHEGMDFTDKDIFGKFEYKYDFSSESGIEYQCTRYNMPSGSVAFSSTYYMPQLEKVQIKLN